MPASLDADNISFDSLKSATWNQFAVQPESFKKSNFEGRILSYLNEQNLSSIGEIWLEKVYQIYLFVR